MFTSIRSSFIQSFKLVWIFIQLIWAAICESIELFTENEVAVGLNESIKIINHKKLISLSATAKHYP